MTNMTKRFKLPSFTLTVRYVTADENSANARGIAEGRDYYAVDITERNLGDKLTLYVGSSVIMTKGSVWNEAAAARSAISFASAPWCADNEQEERWMDMHGEEL